MKYVSAFAGLISVLYLGTFAATTFGTRGKIFDRVASNWSVDIGGKRLEDTTLPYRLDSVTDAAPGATAILSRRIETPARCKDVQCYVFFGEVGDLSKVYIDGHLVRSQGYADNFKSLARQHPLWAELPFGSKELRLEIESLYGIGFGVTRGTPFIGDYLAVTTAERSLTLQSVTFPLMQALVLTALGILALCIWWLAGLEIPVFHFGIFCLAGAAFMLSFSFLPREYLTVSTASAIHFSLRIMSDWALFECLNSMIPINRIFRFVFRFGFALFIGVFGYLLSIKGTYPDFYYATQIVSVLIVAVPMSGLFASMYYWFQNRTLKLPRVLDLELMGPALLVLTVCQSWDTSVFWRLVSGTYLSKFYLVPLAIVLAIVNVKRHLRYHEALKKAKVEAEKDAILGRVAMEFSHDLKSPLGSLRDWSLKALEKNNPEFTKTVLEEVAGKTAIVTKRLQDLFNYARNEIEEKRPTKLLKLVEDVKTELGSQLLDKNINLEIDVPDEYFPLDAENFKRALVNLIDNAIHASSESGTIAVTAKRVGRRLVLSVRDFGVGISEENLSLVFEPYFTTNKAHGTGLGLAIVERITRQHGGQVQVFSKKDAGSTFVVELPL